MHRVLIITWLGECMLHKLFKRDGALNLFSLWNSFIPCIPTSFYIGTYISRGDRTISSLRLYKHR
jgi:hypothetical protein